MRFFLSLLLLIPSLCWGGIQIDFAGYKFVGDSGEYFELSSDGTLTGAVRINIDNSYDLKTLNGAWENSCWDGDDIVDINYCRFTIYSGNLHCDYFVSIKSPNFFWFSLSERNFNNVCFDTLMTREQFEITNLESIFHGNDGSSIEFREIEVK